MKLKNKTWEISLLNYFWEIFLKVICWPLALIFFNKIIFIVMKISRNTGFYQVLICSSLLLILFKKFMDLKLLCYIHRINFSQRLLGFFFKDVFTVFLEIGLEIKNPIVYLLTDFIKLQKIHWCAMSQVRVPICKVVVVYYSQVKNVNLIPSTDKPSVWISIIS